MNLFTKRSENRLKAMYINFLNGFTSKPSTGIGTVETTIGAPASFAAILAKKSARAPWLWTISTFSLFIKSTNWKITPGLNLFLISTDLICTLLPLIFSINAPVGRQATIILYRSIDSLLIICAKTLSPPPNSILSNTYKRLYLIEFVSHSTLLQTIFKISLFSLIVVFLNVIRF